LFFKVMETRVRLAGSGSLAAVSAEYNLARVLMRLPDKEAEAESLIRSALKGLSSHQPPSVVHISFF
jgi:hypothetical protein